MDNISIFNTLIDTQKITFNDGDLHHACLQEPLEFRLSLSDLCLLQKQLCPASLTHHLEDVALLLQLHPGAVPTGRGGQGAYCPITGHLQGEMEDNLLAHKLKHSANHSISTSSDKKTHSPVTPGIVEYIYLKSRIIFNLLFWTRQRGLFRSNQCDRTRWTFVEFAQCNGADVATGNVQAD